MPNTHYTLKVARWSDGSRIYLDSRGMIHLMSSDKRLPQLSFVLSNYPIAGWTSRGHAFGWQFFLPGEATTDAATAGAILRKFIQTLR